MECRKSKKTFFLHNPAINQRFDYISIFFVCMRLRAYSIHNHKNVFAIYIWQNYRNVAMFIYFQLNYLWMLNAFFVVVVFVATLTFNRIVWPSTTTKFSCIQKIHNFHYGKMILLVEMNIYQIGYWHKHNCTIILHWIACPARGNFFFKSQSANKQVNLIWNDLMTLNCCLH